MQALLSKVHNDRRLFWTSFAIVLLIGLWMRLPHVSAGLPYFYHEDEAHHFNRVVRMTQRGEFNPNYFHKPSLHFYLRMPVVAASFLWSVKKGELRSIQEVKTEDPYGLAKYNFTASHPRIVEWNRLLSVALALGLIAAAMKVSWLLVPSWPLAVGTGLLTAFSPALISHAAVIGVDMPMAFFALLAVVFALDFFKTKYYRYLVFASVCAGLATSSKYNALPICAVPLISVFVARSVSWRHIFTALIVPVVSFFAASPFILVSLPLFLDQFAYEIWHYGVAGHVGQMGEPGIKQLIHYLAWIMNDSAGLVGLVLAIVGALYFVLRLEREAIVAFSFPLLLLILMCMQKTNFTRNLLAILPFVSVLVVFGLFAVVDILKRFVSEQRMPYLIGLLFVLVLAQPLLTSYRANSLLAASSDSRDEALAYLHESKNISQELAIAGQLQFPRFTRYKEGKVYFSRLGVERVDETQPIEQLWLQGFDEVVLSGSRVLLDSEQALLKQTKVFEGRASDKARVVRNPTIKVYKFKEDASELVRGSGLELKPIFSLENSQVTCLAQSQEEEHCWLKQRLASFKASKAGELTLSVMSPWPNQEIIFRAGKQELERVTISSDQAGSWLPVTLNIKTAGTYQVEARLVKSPFTQELNSDKRRLAVAFR